MKIRTLTLFYIISKSKNNTRKFSTNKEPSRPENLSFKFLIKKTVKLFFYFTNGIKQFLNFLFITIPFALTKFKVGVRYNWDYTKMYISRSWGDFKVFWRETAVEGMREIHPFDKVSARGALQLFFFPAVLVGKIIMVIINLLKRFVWPILLLTLYNYECLVHDLNFYKYKTSLKFMEIDAYVTLLQQVMDRYGYGLWEMLWSKRKKYFARPTNQENIEAFIKAKPSRLVLSKDNEPTLYKNVSNFTWDDVKPVSLWNAWVGRPFTKLDNFFSNKISLFGDFCVEFSTNPAYWLTIGVWCFIAPYISWLLLKNFTEFQDHIFEVLTQPRGFLTIAAGLLLNLATLDLIVHGFFYIHGLLEMEHILPNLVQIIGQFLVRNCAYAVWAAVTTITFYHCIKTRKNLEVKNTPKL